MNNVNNKDVRKFLEAREQNRKKALSIRYEQARHDFSEIIDVIISKYNPKRIYQWGSLLKKEHFTENSDIDIAVEGITSADQYFSLYGEVMKLTDFSIDLIQLEKVEQEFADIIRLKGKIVYERKE